MLQAEPVANPVKVYVQKLPAVRRRPRVGTHGDKRSGRHRLVDRRYDLGTAIYCAAVDLTDQGLPRKQGAATAAQRAGLQQGVQLLQSAARCMGVGQLSEQGSR